MSERGFSNNSNQNLAGFVPALVIEYLLEKLRKKEVRKLPEKQSFDSVVMFADISGFTNLAEKLSKKGPEGTELLAFALNRYMELLVNGISRSGGDIFKFAGDAMIIVWPPPQNNNIEELTILCRQAMQSALDIQSKLTDFKIIDEVKLSVKIGFGVGQVTIAHVGGVFQRAEYLPAGSPLTQAFECEHLATQGGVVIVSKQIWDLCANFFEFAQITTLHNYKGENSPFFYVTKVKKAVKMKADAFLIKNKFKPGDIEAIRNSLKSYIPAAMVPFIEIDQEKWSAELRRLSVLFINLGIDLSDTQTQPGLERIQIVIECVQRCVYNNQGSLNKFLMDDKGSTLIVVFGLYPMAHQDDPVRAVLTAMNLVSELKPIKCSCSVGITTGMVFAGVVGTSGNRREYSVLGDGVNLSARLMQAACQEKEKKILVDEVTKMEAEHKLRFRFVKKSEVKGKSGEISFFEPVEDDNSINNRKHNETKTSRINIDKIIKIHVVNGWENKRIIGKSYELKSMKVIGLFEKFLSKPAKNGLIMIIGSYGAGKSLLIKEILQKMSNKIESATWKYNEKIQVYANSLNNVEKGRKMNGWRKILQEILVQLALRLKINSESLIFKLTENNEDLAQNLYLVEEILSIKLRSPGSVTQKNKIIQRRQELYEKKIIKKILIKILLKYLEEDEDVADISLEEAMEKSTSFILNGSNNEKKKTDNSKIVSPLIIFLDDMQDYDSISWEFTFKVLRRIKKVFIFACIRNKYIEQPPVFKKQDSPSPKQNSENNYRNSQRRTLNNIKSGFTEFNNQEEIIESGMYELEEICENSFYLKIELKGLEKNEIEQLLTKYFSVKNVEFSDYSSIDRFYQFIIDKTEGNPLEIFHLLEKLMSSNYSFLNSEKKTLILKKELLKMIEINELLTLDTPLCRQKVNGPIIDRLSVHHLLIMKAASVIGNCFDLQTLLKVNPYKSSISAEKVRAVINELEKQDFIEILDDQQNNVHYRFTSPFMREVIYQRMIYNQRRILHRYVAEAIQAIPLTSLNLTEEKIECDRLTYHWCLAENKDPFMQNTIKDPGVDFSNKAKRSIIVKKISSLLSKNPNNLNVIIKKGDLAKKSDRGNKWSKRYCLMNTREFQYYYSEDDYQKNDISVGEALGTIPFKNIFQIMPIKETESKGKEFAFVIYVGSWQKKDKEMGIREFYFSAYSYDELEQWTTYMEFIRAKAIYDSFVNTFGKISFPLTNNALEKLDSIDDGMKLQQGLSRLTYLTKNEGSHKSLSKSQKIRKTNFKPINLGGKLKNKDLLLSESRESLNYEAAISTYNADYQKKLKDRLIKFFQSAFFLFWSHTFEMANTTSRKEGKNDNVILIGNNTSFMREKNHHFFFERTLFDDVSQPQSLVDKRISKNNTSFSINFRSSNASLHYNSIDSLEDYNSNGDKNLNNEKQQMVSSLAKQLTSVDENITEEMNSPLNNLTKNHSLKSDEKLLQAIIKCENDQNIKDDSISLISLKKIEEVPETRASVIGTSDKKLENLRKNSRENDQNGFIQKIRKSRFNQLSQNTNETNSSINIIQDSSNQKPDPDPEVNILPKGKKESILMEDSLKSLPILSTIGNKKKYIEENNGDFEVVVKTKKGNFNGKNENYGDLQRRQTKNEINNNASKNSKQEENIDDQTSFSYNNNSEVSLKELQRNPAKKLKEEDYGELDNHFVEKSRNSKNMNKKEIETKKERNIEVSLEKWEKENSFIANEEEIKERHEIFSAKDYMYLEFPKNLTKISKNFNDTIQFETLHNKTENEEEEIIIKKKLKNYSGFTSRNENVNVPDEKNIFFKDYESLVNSNKWNSKKKDDTETQKSYYSSEKQENLLNLNYKTIKNFQKKNL